MENEEFVNSDIETLHTITDAEMRKTAQVQCKEHKFVKINDEEVSCQLCPSVFIVGDADSFLTSGQK